MKKFILSVIFILVASNVFAGYSLDKSSTTNGGGTWDSILKLSGSISGTNITFTVEKQSGSFSSSGTMYLKVGTYESYGANRDYKRISAGNSSVSFTHNLDNYSGQYPKEFYGRFKSDAVGYAWVGPITVKQSNSAPNNPSISSSPSYANINETVNISVTRGADPDGDQVKVQCTATNSNRTDSSPYVSSWSNGGSSTTATFKFNSVGTQTIYCTTFDQDGLGSSTVQRSITVNSAKPTVSGLSSNQNIELGKSYTLTGTVYAGSGDKLIKVTAAVGDNKTAMTSGSINATSYSLSNFTFKTSTFNSTGTYTIGIWAATSSYPDAVLIDQFSITVNSAKPTIDNISPNTFTVGPTDQWIVINGSNFSNAISGYPKVFIDGIGLDGTDSMGRATATYVNSGQIKVKAIVIHSGWEGVDYIKDRNVSIKYNDNDNDKITKINAITVNSAKPTVSGLSSNQNIELGKSYTLTGTVYAGSGDKLIKVTAAVGDNKTAMTSGSINAISYGLSNFTFKTSTFNSTGTYTIGIWAATSSYPDAVLIDQFSITVNSAKPTISGKITDSNGGSISGVIITLFSDGGQTLSTATTDQNGMYQFSGIAPGYYEVRAPENAGYYPLHENGTSFRFVEIVDDEISISEVNFTKDEFSPFVKLLFPRTGDKLKGDFGIFGTAFKGEGSTCKEINRVEILLNENEKYYGSFYGSTSDRFSLSQIVWKNIANNQTIPQTWEYVLSGTSGYVSLQIRARNQDGVWGYSEKVNIAKANTTATVAISHPNFQVPFPVSEASKTLGYQISGATSSTVAWYVFRRVTLPCDLQNAQDVEFDARAAGETISECYPLDDVYPVCVAVRDGANNTLVDIENIMVYAAAKKGHPGRNNSGSQLAALGVNVVSGNFYYQTTDMLIEGVGIPFELWRRYNSIRPDDNEEETWMGKGGWGHSYDYIIFMSKSGRRLYLSMPDGHWERFALINGVWQTMTPSAFGVVMETENNTFTVWDKNMTSFRFSHIGGNWWRPTTIKDRNGKELTLTYVPTSSDSPWKVNLETINDTRGRIITFFYDTYLFDGHNLLTSVSDGTGRSVHYKYDGGKRLRQFTDRRGKTWEYANENVNAKWLLTQIKDPRGNTLLTNEYDALGRVITQTDALGNKWLISYVSDVLTNITNPLGETTHFGIDPATKMITSIESAGSEISSYTYKKDITANTIQEVSLIQSFLSPRHYGTGKATTSKYSDIGTGNLEQLIEPSGRTTKLTWIENRVGANKNLLDTITLPGISTPFNFNYANEQNGNITEIIDPLGQKTSYAYNNGQIKSATDARNNTISYTYDAQNYLTRITDPAEQFIRYTYDAFGRVWKLHDKKTNTTTYEYNKNDQLVKVIDPDGNYVSYEYDDSGNMTSIRDKRANAVSCTFNAANLLTSASVIADSQQYVVTYDYDKLLRIKKVTNARNNDYQTIYDPSGRLKTALNPLNQSVEYTYDKNGNTTKVEEKNSGGSVIRTVSYSYDDLDRVLTKKINVGGSTLKTEYTYNAKGLVATIKNPKGKTTEFKYDDLGRLTSVIDANGKTTAAEYDANGNVTKVIDPDSNYTRYEYDKLNRMTKRIDNKNNTWKYVYDPNGNLASLTDPQNRITSYIYDKLNRRTKETFNDASFVQYTYDLNGNLSTIKDALGTTYYLYDEINRLTSRTDCFGKIINYNYDKGSNIVGISYPGKKKIQYVFDDAGKMTSVTDWLNQSTTYGYNALGQIVSVLHGNGSKTNIGYDSAGRLTSYTDKKSNGSVIASYSYTLDPNGNRLSATVTEPIIPKFSNGEYNFQYNALNQLTSGPNGGFTFDTNGNLIQEVANGKTINYDYNDNDRLVSWSNGAKSYQYAYSGTKNLVEVEKDSEKTRYVLDVNRNLPAVVARTNGSGEISDYFVYGATGLVSKITPAGQAFTYHFDPTGNTVAMSDSSEDLVNKYAYTPYGKTTRQESIDNPFEYIGKFGVMAEGNGLNYMRARFYHSGIRRFLNQDTVWGNVASPQSLNLYAYVEGNPITYIDPLGLYSRYYHIFPSSKNKRIPGEGFFQTYIGKRIFDGWLKSEQNDNDWLDEVPPCENKILITDEGKAVINNAIWKDPDDANPEHKGAVYEVRSQTTKHGHSNQCSYDANWYIIKGEIPAAGTADRCAVEFGSILCHIINDYLPWKLAEILNREEDYYSVRPTLTKVRRPQR